MLDRTSFAAAFAADVAPEISTFMANAQRPWNLSAREGKVSNPAWKTKPSWYLIPRDDRIIPLQAQRQMAAKVRELPGSHAIYVSNPEAVAAVITEVMQASALARP